MGVGSLEPEGMDETTPTSDQDDLKVVRKCQGNLVDMGQFPVIGSHVSSLSKKRKTVHL